MTVDTAAGCGWTASSNASWITIESGRTGLGPGSIRFTSTDNYDAARQDVIKIRWPTPTEGQNVRVTQEGCTYVFDPIRIMVPACGGDWAFYVFSGSTDVGFCGHVGPMGTGPCVWSALSTASWITVLTPMGHGEEGRHSFRVAPNDDWKERTATITVQYPLVDRLAGARAV